MATLYRGDHQSFLTKNPDRYKATFNLPNKSPERTVIAERQQQGVYKTWYRKYCDGWVEEGGFVPVSGCARNSTYIAGEPEFFFEQGTIDYDFSFTSVRTGAYWASVGTTGYKLSTTKIHLELYNNADHNWSGGSDNGVYWRIAGYGKFVSDQQCRIFIKY